MRFLRRFAILLCAAAMGCGGASDLPRRSDVSVTIKAGSTSAFITPAVFTMRVGETLNLVGTATGFTNPTLMWWQQDHHDAHRNQRLRGLRQHHR